MKNKKIKRVISMLATGFLIVCTALCLILVVKTSIGADPSIFGFRCFYIVSGSMEPTIPMDSAIIVHKSSDYDVGDVITFRSENQEIYGSPNTHRIIEKLDENGVVLFRTQGDANPVADSEKVRVEQIYGKVVFHTGKIEWISTLISFMVTPGGFLTVICIPILLITVLSMKDYLKSLKKSIMISAAGEKTADGGNAKEEQIPPENATDEKPEEKEKEEEQL